MLKRMVTRKRFQNQLREDTHKGVLLAIALGAVFFLVALVFVCYSEGVSARTEALGEVILKKALEMPCDSQDKFSGPGAIALKGCTVDFGKTNLLNLSFANFDDIIPPDLVGQPVIAKRVRVEHYSRRRKACWKDVGTDGTAASQTWLAETVKVGRYNLTEEMKLGAKLEEKWIDIRPPAWQRTGGQAKPQTGGWGAVWTMTPEYMSKDNIYLTAGDTRISFSYKNATFLSVLGYARTGDAGDLELGRWHTGDAFVGEVGRVEAGSLTKAQLVQNLEGEASGWAIVNDLLCGVVAFVGLWMLIWPVTFCCCIRCFLVTGVCVISGDTAEQSFPPGTGCSEDGNCRKCLTTSGRALILGASATALATLAGWLCFHYGILYSLIVVAVVIGFIILVELFPRIIGLSQLPDEESDEEGGSDSSPGHQAYKPHAKLAPPFNAPGSQAQFQALQQSQAGVYHSPTSPGSDEHSDGHDEHHKEECSVFNPKVGPACLCATVFLVAIFIAEAAVCVNMGVVKLG